MDKIVIENLIMRAVFDVLMGKKPDSIYTDEMSICIPLRSGSTKIPAPLIT